MVKKDSLPTFTHTRHAPLLDLLRASAALLVLFGHTRNWIFVNIGAVDHPNLLLKFFWLVTVLEHEAVVIFFVLSGFLVGGSILRAFEKNTFNLGHYLAARFARIYIVYVPALILTALIFWIGNHFVHDFGGDTIRPLFSSAEPDLGGARSMLCHAAGLQGFLCEAWKQNPVLWSLGYEWVLYLFAPPILWFATSGGKIAVRLFGIGLILCAASVMSIDIGDWAFWFFAWFLGVFASHVFDNRSLPMAAGILGLSLAVGAMALSHLQSLLTMETDVLIACGISLAISCRSLVVLPLAPRFFKEAASFSYSLYATHLPLVFLIIALLQNTGSPTRKMQPSVQAFGEFLICSIIPLLFAYVFSLFTERQTDRFRAWVKSMLV